jgi:dolichol-phosphate mannosyltransferase
MNCQGKGATVITDPAVATSSPPAVIAAVIPCYKVARHILEVIRRFGRECVHIYVVDDCCPEASGRIVEQHCTDPRVKVLYNPCNLGVGGAVLAGYRQAIEAGATVIVKIDGDGQMAPELLPHFVAPILAGEADYTKGNRFYDLANISRMPGVRIFGNGVLSVMAKLSTGYWDIFDPTNGYTAIHAEVAKRLPFEKISQRYFFETDILFRLNTIRAVVADVPMDAVYGDESSSLKVSKILGEFLLKHIENFGKRIFYNYFLRDMSIASLELVAGVLLLLFGVSHGGYHWLKSAQAGISTPAGTVMLAALPILMGLQFLIAFLNYDIASVPRRPRHFTFSSKFSMAGGRRR